MFRALPTLQHPRKPASLRLSCEALEDRWCPTCAVVQDGSTLFITGDRGDNRIELVQIDDPELRVACDGGAWQSFFGVDHIVIDMKAGNDELSGHLSHMDDVWAALGLGDDSAHLTILGTPATDDSDTAMRLTLLGEEGFDQLTVALENPTLDGNSDSVPQRPRHITLDGGRGDDELRVTVGDSSLKGSAQLLTGDLAVRVFGGNGSDRATILNSNLVVEGSLSVVVELGVGDDRAALHNLHVAGAITTCIDGSYGNDVITQAADSCSGIWRSTSLGGYGDDRLEVLLVGIDDPDLFEGLVDGGAGFDSASTSGLVPSRNCEVVEQS